MGLAKPLGKKPARVHASELFLEVEHEVLLEPLSRARSKGLGVGHRIDEVEMQDALRGETAMDTPEEQGDILAGHHGWESEAVYRRVQICCEWQDWGYG